MTPAAPAASLNERIALAAQTAGIEIRSSEPATSFAGQPTTRYTLARPGEPGKTLQLEVSDSLDVSAAETTQELQLFLAETANRLRNAVPNAMVTLSGIPLVYTHFAWPFHSSTAGADTSVVHGQVTLEDGTGSGLHAKVAAALTVTMREVVRFLEQPFAESFVLNAIRKTLDQGQLDLVKSGNRQPVPVTSRYFSSRQKKFNFNDTTEAQRRNFLASKTFWLSGLGSGSSAVWLLDPRDAQYLNASVAELKLSAEALGKDGLVTASADPAYALPTPALLARGAEFHGRLQEALAFIKPTFNEEMRGGHTNM